jgi:hypothetical protein
MIAKEISFLGERNYTAPHYSDVQLTANLRVIYDSDGIILYEEENAPNAWLWDEDVLPLGEVEIALTRIDAQFSAFDEDGILLAEAELPLVYLRDRDAVRMGEGEWLAVRIEDGDGVTLADEEEVFWQYPGEKWGAVKGEVTPYQEKT